MIFLAAALASTINAADCEHNMAFSVHLKPHGYVCLSNSGQFYVEFGTNLDAAAQTFLETLGKTARKLNEHEFEQWRHDDDGT